MRSSVSFLILAFLIITVVMSVSAEDVHHSRMIRSLLPLRPDRIKRQLWTGWRCSGVNGVFLDCTKK
uniref:Liver-expressed antimicrobial peptide 2 n=1 Tax=Steinernema glaseri TaxID=37863 RepID=A0A1I7ZFW6_9BILA